MCDNGCFTIRHTLIYMLDGTQRHKLIQIMGGGKQKYSIPTYKKNCRCAQLYINNNKMYQIKIENIIYIVR